MVENSAHCTIVSLDPRTDPRWADLVEREDLSLFSSPPWLSAVADAYDFEAEAIAVLDSEGGIRSGFPYAIIHDLRGGRRVVYPFCDYCDPVVRDEADWRSMEGALGTATLPMTFRVLRKQPFEKLPEMRETGRAKWHRIRVLESPEAQWTDLRGNARQMIRKARRSGVTTSIGSGQDRLRRFYELHAQVRRAKYRMLTQPFAFFEQLALKFGDDLQIAFSHHDGTVVGGSLYVRWGNTLYYKFSASALGHLGVRPNEIALWEAIEFAREKGISYIDLGISGLDQPGLSRYKEKFAQESEEVRYLRRPAELEEAPQNVDELQALTERLCEPTVPEEVYLRAGDVLYRVFC